MAQQNPFTEMWTDPATNPFLEMWTETPTTDTAGPWTGPAANPVTAVFRPFQEAANFWTEWALTGFEDNFFLDPDLCPFGGVDVSVDLPLADASTLLDVWVDIVESWLALLGADSDEFTSVPIE